MILDLFDHMSGWTLFFWSTRILGIFFIPSVLMRRTTRPVSALAWILALLFVPILGVLLWWLIGRDRMGRRRRAKIQSRSEIAQRFAKLGPLPTPQQYSLTSSQARAVAKLDPQIHTLRLVLRDRFDVFPATTNNLVSIHRNAGDAYDAFARAITAAENHVHFLFYAFKNDATGTRFRDLLSEKARQGVEVRVLYDAIGSVGLSSSFLQPLRDAGAHVACFLPLHFWEPRMRINFRNHRKLLIIDGSCGFTGGINIADDYLEWFDMAFGFEGPVVHQMQEIFAEDWYFTTGEDLVDAPYFPGLPAALRLADEPSTEANPPQVGAPVSLANQGYEIVENTNARIVAGGPDEPLETIHKMFFLSITSARKRLFIITAYFVPDGAILTALQTAAMRGVDVRLILPGTSDHDLTRHAARSFWEALLETGVRLFEFRGPILHAKLHLMDTTHVLVGSANMDIRSFRLSFEANTVIASRAFNRAMTEVFIDAQARSQEVILSDFRDRPSSDRLKEGVARLFSPLL